MYRGVCRMGHNSPVDICLRRIFPDISKMSIHPVAISSIMKKNLANVKSLNRNMIIYAILFSRSNDLNACLEPIYSLVYSIGKICVNYASQKYDL